MSDAYKPEEPEAAKADVLPLEAPECNDGDDCCRYCGRGLQPCGACKPAPPADAATEACYFDVVFDGPPEHVSGRFVEVENQRGASIRVGEWVHRPDGFWALRIPRVTPPAAASTGAVREAAERLKAHISLSATKAALRHAARELQYVLDSNPCDQYDIHQTVEGKACVALAEGLLGPMQDWPDEENASAILSALAASRGAV